MWSQQHSERCTRPSAPPIETKAPKSARLVTRPTFTSPSARSSMTLSRIMSRVSLLAERSERIRRWRSRSTSITLTLMGWPIISLYLASGVSPLMLSRRLMLSWEAGIKPRMVERGTIKPPLLKEMIVESITSLAFIDASASLQACSSTALVKESTRLPLESSGVITKTGMEFPTFKVERREAGMASYSFPVMMPSDLAPTLTSICPSVRLAMIPSRISPAFGKSRIKPSASSRAAIF